MLVRRHLVLSTAHVAARTALLLDDWSLRQPYLRPLVVASTHDGWFVATHEVQGAARKQIPNELLVAMQFGREEGCEYLLFDCDGPVIRKLVQFAW